MSTIHFTEWQRIIMRKKFETTKAVYFFLEFQDNNLSINEILPKA